MSGRQLTAFLVLALLACGCSKDNPPPATSKAGPGDSRLAWANNPDAGTGARAGGGRSEASWRDRQLNDAEYRKGEQFFKAKDYSTALVCFGKAIQGDSKNYAAYVRRSDCYRHEATSDQSDLLTKALDDITFALAHAEECPFDKDDLYTSRANCYARLGGDDNRLKAIADCSEAIRLNSRNGYAYYLRALAYHRIGGDGNNEKAVRDCTEAIRIDSKDAHAYYLRSRAKGQIAGLFGDSSDARKDYNEAKRLDPNIDK